MNINNRNLLHAAMLVCEELLLSDSMSRLQKYTGFLMENTKSELQSLGTGIDEVINDESVSFSLEEEDADIETFKKSLKIALCGSFRLQPGCVTSQLNITEADVLKDMKSEILLDFNHYIEKRELF